MISRSRLAIICFLSFASAATAEEAYTNLAGKVINATPVKVAAGQVTFVRNATTNQTGRAGRQSDQLTLPLRIFPPPEQARIKAAAGLRELPPGLQGLADEIAYQRRRVVARHKAGRMTDAELAEYLENLDGSWRHAVETANLNKDEKNHWLKIGAGER